MAGTRTRRLRYRPAFAAQRLLLRLRRARVCPDGRRHLPRTLRGALQLRHREPLPDRHTPGFRAGRGTAAVRAARRVVDELRGRGTTVEGRPLVWFHHWVTPDWMRQLSYHAAARSRVEQHVREVVRHYGERVQVWEVANEMHDWANELRLTPDQLVEVTKLACEVARDTNPRVQRLINNCCVFGGVRPRSQVDGARRHLSATYAAPIHAATPRRRRPVRYHRRADVFSVARSGGFHPPD